MCWGWHALYVPAWKGAGNPIRVTLSGFAGGKGKLCLSVSRTRPIMLIRVVSAPTGLKTIIPDAQRGVSTYGFVPCRAKTIGIFTHRLRSGLLLHPEGVSLSCPGRGVRIVAHCVSGGKLL